MSMTLPGLSQAHSNFVLAPNYDTKDAFRLTPYKDQYRRWWLVQDHYARKWRRLPETGIEIFEKPNDIQWPGPFKTKAAAEHILILARLMQC